MRSGKCHASRAASGAVFAAHGSRNRGQGGNQRPETLLRAVAALWVTLSALTFSRRNPLSHWMTVPRCRFRPWTSYICPPPLPLLPVPARPVFMRCFDWSRIRKQDKKERPSRARPLPLMLAGHPDGRDQVLHVMQSSTHLLWDSKLLAQEPLLLSWFCATCLPFRVGRCPRLPRPMRANPSQAANEGTRHPRLDPYFHRGRAVKSRGGAIPNSSQHPTLLGPSLPS